MQIEKGGNICSPLPREEEQVAVMLLSLGSQKSPDIETPKDRLDVQQQLNEQDDDEQFLLYSERRHERDVSQSRRLAAGGFFCQFAVPQKKRSDPRTSYRNSISPVARKDIGNHPTPSDTSSPDIRSASPAVCPQNSPMLGSYHSDIELDADNVANIEAATEQELKTGEGEVDVKRAGETKDRFHDIETLPSYSTKGRDTDVC